MSATFIFGEHRKLQASLTMVGLMKTESEKEYA